MQCGHCDSVIEKKDFTMLSLGCYELIYLCPKCGYIKKDEVYHSMYERGKVRSFLNERKQKLISEANKNLKRFKVL